MPLHMVEHDIAAGTLVVLDVDEMPRTGFMLAMSAFHPASAPPGPAERWFVDHLKAGFGDAFEAANRADSGGMPLGKAAVPIIDEAQNLSAFCLNSCAF